MSIALVALVAGCSGEAITLGPQGVDPKNPNDMGGLSDGGAIGGGESDTLLGRDMVLPDVLEDGGAGGDGLGGGGLDTGGSGTTGDGLGGGGGGLDTGGGTVGDGSGGDNDGSGGGGGGMDTGGGTVGDGSGGDNDGSGGGGGDNDGSSGGGDNDGSGGGGGDNDGGSTGGGDNDGSGGGGGDNDGGSTGGGDNDGSGGGGDNDGSGGGGGDSDGGSTGGGDNDGSGGGGGDNDGGSTGGGDNDGSGGGGGDNDGGSTGGDNDGSGGGDDGGSTGGDNDGSGGGDDGGSTGGDNDGSGGGDDGGSTGGDNDGSGGGGPIACQTAADCADMPLAPCEGSSCGGDGFCKALLLVDGTPCDDDDVCTFQTSCQAGACQGPAVACDDGNPCTDDVCDAVQGCEHPFNNGPCDDGNVCTEGDVCAAGFCQAGAANVCPCDSDAACADKNDANLCNGSLTCSGGFCQLDPNSVVLCPPGPAGACFVNVCEPSLGACIPAPKADGASCDDANPCTTSDACVAGACAGQTGAACSDGNPCTNDLCDKATGCSFVAIEGAPCADGNPCTAGDACVAGQCQPGAPTDCDDGNPCTTDLCDELAGCQYLVTDGASCDDGNPCTENDACQGDSCTPGAFICLCLNDSDCAWLNPQADLCAGTWSCQSNACALDPATVVQCDAPDDPCQVAACDPSSGACVTSSLADGEPCDDGSVCTTETACAGGACQGIPALSCDDNNPCTSDGCDPALGCTHTPNALACNDGDACTSGDLCADGACAPGAALICDDGNPCTTDLCDPDSGCVSTPNSEPCEDGNPCTAGDVCAGGSCKAGPSTCECESDADCAAKEDGDLCNGTLVCLANSCVVDAATVISCADGNPDDCLTFACDPASGACKAQLLPEGAACSDGNVCTGGPAGDACSFGVCQAGAPLACDDGNPCTADGCDPAAGCTHAPIDGGPCEDGDACTIGTGCQQGVCSSGQPLVCDDGNPCTDNSCAADVGCVFVPNNAGCDDGDACTPVDTCQGGQCVPGDNICQCQTNADCAALDDADLCNGSYICSGNSCVIDPATVVSCPADEACATYSCQPSTGDCQASPEPDGQACDDNNACTQGEVCAAGACEGGAPASCDDGNICTASGCDPQSGCFFTPVAASTLCNDGDACTLVDACADGDCAGTGKLTCDDGKPCTADACDKAVGCKNTPLEGSPCEDGDKCTVGDACAGDACVSGGPKTCADGGACAVVACDPTTGACKANNLDGQPCEDNNACTQNEVCSGGACVGTGVSCDDGNPCTNDSCSPASGCAYADNKLPCSDGNACTVGDVCETGSCAPGKPKLCDDGNPCTTDACDAGSGQCTTTSTNSPCDDGNACTLGDVCGGNGVCAGTGISCNDGDPCTTDSCDPASGCKNTVTALPCDDGDACTTGDVCGAAGCKGTPGNAAALCDDGNPCTTDVCDSQLGCVQVPNNAACDDGNACTVGDQCSGGSCEAGTNTCQCNTNADCAGQEDGNLCNGTLFCDKSSLPFQCKTNPATVVTCDTNGDGTCFATACNPLTGACGVQPKNNGQACDADGSVCTSGDVCSGGACAAGPSLDCNDGNACTVDACDPIQGCIFTASNAPCSDGNACTVGDSCNGGVCVSGNGTECKDGNLCTVDGCNPETGVCFFNAESATGLPCDADGNVCTVGDACQNGACFPGGPLDCDDGNACTTDSCSPDGGCKHTPNAALCNDGDACTGPDACQGGVCDGPAVDCDDINPCTIDSCIPATGCKGTAVPDKTACGPVDLCFSGQCVAATCGDGVVTVAIGEECDDGNTEPGDGCRADCTKEDTACADGDRDGTMTASEYPKIAACSGPWQGHIASLSPSALCGPEFHVCNSNDAALLKTIKQKDAFQTGCWSINAANDFGGCGPCSNGPNSNDMAGVGKNCQGKITNWGSSCISNSYRIDSANQTCVRPSTDSFSWINGVMCCANEP